jgi:hypothetical protein
MDRRDTLSAVQNSAAAYPAAQQSTQREFKTEALFDGPFHPTPPQGNPATTTDPAGFLF